MSEEFDQIAETGQVRIFGREWHFSPSPLVLTPAECRVLEGMGHILARFQHACDTLYRRSVGGSLPGWIARLLDAGKPEWMVEAQRETGRRGLLPRVIRPDLILGHEGFGVTELDGVPGGMGVTAWLARLYAGQGHEILGGAEGMVEGFRSITAEGTAMMISEEAQDYRGEMEWLVEQSGGGRQVVTPEEWNGVDPVYRFFEWFDWEASPSFRRLAEGAAAGELELTSACLPHLEEKLWLALLWSPALRGVWKEALRGNYLRRLREWVPFGWVVDPQPLPPHAVLPRVEASGWDEVGEFSQKERELVLKISGFHETAWGSRGVYIGHDLPQAEWAERIQMAAESFGRHPWIMQEFREGRIVEHPVFDGRGGIETMRGRVRLCPYYFLGDDGKAKLGGCLATLVTADKKKIHGMNDAVLLPCMPG